MMEKLSDLSQKAGGKSLSRVLLQVSTGAGLDDLIKLIKNQISSLTDEMNNDSTESKLAKDQLTKATDARSDAAADFSQQNLAHDEAKQKMNKNKKLEEQQKQIQEETEKTMAATEKQRAASKALAEKNIAELFDGLTGIENGLTILNQYYGSSANSDHTASSVTADNTQTVATTSADGNTVSNTLKGSYSGSGQSVLMAVEAIRDQTQNQHDEAVQEEKDEVIAFNILMTTLTIQKEDAIEARANHKMIKDMANIDMTTAAGLKSQAKKALKQASEQLKVVKTQFLTMESFDEGQAPRMREIDGLKDALKIVRQYMQNEE